MDEFDQALEMLREARDRLEDAIQDLNEARSRFTEASSKVWKLSQAAQGAALSKRETQAFRLLLDNKTNKEIANEMSVTPRTVKYFVSRIFEKCKVQSRHELLRRGEKSAS